MFHNIKRPNRNDIVVVDNDQDLWRELDHAPGWTVIEYSPHLQRLPLFEQKNGLFLNYIHYKGDYARLESYFPRMNQSKAITDTGTGELLFQTIDAEHALSNITALVGDEYTVLVVREKYGYLCPITEQTFFRELVFCLILDEKEYDTFKQRVGKDV